MTAAATLPARRPSPASISRTGNHNALERMRLAFDLAVAALQCPSDLESLVREKPRACGEPVGGRPVLLLNGRCPISYGPIANLEVGQSVVEASSR